MSAFNREQTDDQWALSAPVPPSVILNIDEKTKKSITESGGTWTPISPIVIGGAGIELQSTMALMGGAKLYPKAPHSFTFGDDDYFRFQGVQTRVMRQSAAEFAPTPETFPREARLIPGLPGSATGFGATSSQGLMTKRPGAFLRIPLRVPDGSTLLQVQVYFSVLFTHTSLPSRLPSTRIVKIDQDGNVTPYATNGPSEFSNLTIREGWAYPAPSTVSVWNNSGAVQSIIIAPYSQFDAADRTTYDYALEWREETGANAFPADTGNVIWSVDLTVEYFDLHPY